MNGDEDRLTQAMDSLIRHGEIGMAANPVAVVIPPVWHEGQGIPPAK